VEEAQEAQEEDQKVPQVCVPLEEKDDKDVSEENVSAVERAKIDDFCISLHDCQSRDLIDKAAQDFCYMNTKGNRKRLARALFAVPRTAYSLIPYYARLIAILANAMPDISEMVASWLEQEFFQYVRAKTDSVMETRLKNVRFLAEMVKFKLIRPGVIFNCLQKCLDDFTQHNIEVACNLLEVAGRFLFRTKQTHMRTKNMLETMMRLKNAKNLDSRLDTMVQNAYYVCKPPEKSAKSQRKVRPIELEYVRYLFFAKLSKHTSEDVVKQLRKMDWKTCGNYIIKCLLKVHKCKYNQIYLIASLVASLARYHPYLPVYVVDDLLSEMRYLMHANDFGKQQRMMSLSKLVGELYSDAVIDSSIVFDVLYMFISPGTEHAGTMPDPPGDHFRIRLVCTLLDTCGHYFDQGNAAKRLDLFLARFERYLLTKMPIAMDVEFTLTDTIETLRYLQ
jgi:regulator of nonsense transcripts 2